MKVVFKSFFLFLLSQNIVQSAEIKMAYFDSFAPASFMEDGKMKGFLIDIAEAVLAKKLGHKVTHTGAPWARAQTQVKSGDMDGLFTGVTPERKTYLNFSDVIMLVGDTRAYFASTNPKIAELRKIKKKDDLKAFTQVNYIGNSIAEIHLSKFQLSYVPTADLMLKTVEAGRYDLTVLTSFYADYYIKKLGIKLESVPIDEIPGTKFQIGIRLDHPKSKEITEKLNKACEEVKADGTVDKIMANYK